MASVEVAGNPDLEEQRPGPIAASENHPGEPVAKAKPVAPRLFVLDNVKFFLTMFVVAEHTTFQWATTRWFTSIFHPWTLTFLMPTYVVISGYTSATHLSDSRKVDGIIKVGVIYFTCQTCFLLLLRYAQPFLHTTAFGDIMMEWGRPFMENASWTIQDYILFFWALWYLQFLIAWRVILPFWWRLRWPLVTAWVWCAVMPCFKIWQSTDQWEMKLDEVFAWFPLFLLGAVAKERKWQMWDHPRSRLAGLIVLLALTWIPYAQTVPWGQPLSTWTPASFCPGTIGGIHAETWHYIGHLDSMNGAVGDGFLGRLAKTLTRMLVNVVQGCCVWGILHLAPRREWPIITSFGSRSLANYVFHPLSGMLMSYTGVFGKQFGVDTPRLGELFVIIMIVPTSLFWMSPWVWKVASPILDPPLHWVLKEPVTREAKQPSTKEQCELPSLLANRRGHGEHSAGGGCSEKE